MSKCRKRILSVLLCVVLLCSALPVSAGADSTGVCFTAVDDHLKELEFSPVYYGGTAYISARVLADCGIYYIYYESSETAQVFTSTKYVFFDIANGTAYDENYNYFSALAYLRNGVAYVPVAWICSYFGLTFSYIAGKGSGDILRIKSGATLWLTDKEFLSAASSLMQTRYDKAYGVKETPDPSGGTTQHNDTVITLSVIGLPTEAMLSSLSRYGYKACFFISEDEVAANSDLIRRIAGSEHSIGIYCTRSPSAVVATTQDAIFDAAQLLPNLIYSVSAQNSACLSYASDNGLACYTPDYTIADSSSSASTAISQIGGSYSGLNLCFETVSAAENYLVAVMNYLKTNEYSVIALRETSF